MAWRRSAGVVMLVMARSPNPFVPGYTVASSQFGLYNFKMRSNGPNLGDKNDQSTLRIGCLRPQDSRCHRGGWPHQRDRTGPPHRTVQVADPGAAETAGGNRCRAWLPGPVRPDPS